MEQTTPALQFDLGFCPCDLKINSPTCYYILNKFFVGCTFMDEFIEYLVQNDIERPQDSTSHNWTLLNKHNRYQCSGKSCRTLAQTPVKSRDIILSRTSSMVENAVRTGYKIASLWSKEGVGQCLNSSSMVKRKTLSGTVDLQLKVGMGYCLRLQLRIGYHLGLYTYMVRVGTGYCGLWPKEGAGSSCLTLYFCDQNEEIPSWSITQ